MVFSPPPQSGYNGPRFDAEGDLARSPYRMFRYDGTRFVDVK